VNPASLSSSQGPDLDISQTLTISNTGDALLTWDIDTASDGNCISPDNSLTWASVSPTGGQVNQSSSTNVDVHFISQNLDPGFSDSGALCVTSNDSGNSPITVPLSLTVVDPTTTEERLATAEIPGTGVVTGTYLDTQTNDGIAQVITEKQQGGRPSNRRDAMEHTWVFELQSGSGLTFSANAWVIEPVTEGDNILLSYSGDNTNFTTFHTISSSSSANDIVVPIPDHAAGSFYIRAMDANRQPGNYDNASVHIDNMSIAEGGTPMPPTYIEMTVGSLDDLSELSNQRNRWDGIVEVAVVETEGTADPVEGAVVSGSWSNGANGGGSCTTDINGLCTIKKPRIKLNVPTATFTVNNVTRGGDTYFPTITTITVSPPLPN
jgi:hypothetical protein